MSENRFTVWHMFGLLIIAASVAILFLGGGLFFGYQVGRSSTLATSVAIRASSTTIPYAQNQVPPVQVNTSGPYLGVEFETLTPALVRIENLTVNTGAIIRNVMPNSPAAKAGLKQGDIIQAVDGQTLTTSPSFRDLIHQHQPGDTLSLTVWRAGQTGTYPVTLVPVPSGFDFSFPESGLSPSLQIECYSGPCPSQVPSGNLVP